jgi:hypothetical protein
MLVRNRSPIGIEYCRKVLMDDFFNGIAPYLTFAVAEWTANPKDPMGVWLATCALGE